MPQVYLTVKAGAIMASDMPAFVKKVQEVVAEALHVPQVGELKPEDVEIAVAEPGPYDVVRDSVSLIVLANEYPARRENLAVREENMQKVLAEAVAGVHASSRWPERTLSAWILLAPGAYSRGDVPERWRWKK